MEYFFHHLFIWFVMNTIHACSAESGRFVIVSDYKEAVKFYPEIRNTKPDFQSALDIDLPTKQQICRDIFSNYIFLKEGKFPHDGNYGNCFYRMLGWYKENYVTRKLENIITFGNPAKVTEYLFSCLVRDNLYSPYIIKEYYVSGEYNLNTTSNAPEDYIAGRFIFSVFETWLSIDELVEVPAKIVSGPDYNVEEIYLERRDQYRSGLSESTDALCKLDYIEKLRICAAVFNSTYFVGKIDFPPSRIDGVEGRCAKNTISFRTESGKSKTADRTALEEWVMKCNPRMLHARDFEDNFDYLLSHAYEDNQIFVYFRENDEFFLENLSTNVRIKVRDFIHKHNGVGDEGKSIRKRNGIYDEGEPIRKTGEDDEVATIDH